MKVEHWRSAATAVAISFLLPACSEAPLGPRPGTALAPLRHVESEAHYIDDGVISVTLPTGRYTLDTRNSTLRIPGNVIISDIPTDVVEQYAESMIERINNAAAEA